jgi:acetyl-CoA carboxylase biotin carboxyl carrier protein
VSDGPDLTPEDVKEILRLVDESGLEELELETPRFTVRFRRNTDPDHDDVSRTRDPGAGPREESHDISSPAEAGQLVEVTALMVGTFYRAPASGESPFVEVGSPVDEETIVCIIEIMKLMSSITAGVRGTIAEVCVDNATPVQYGDVLFRVRQR